MSARVQTGAARGYAGKRIFDGVMAALGIATLWPLALLLATAIAVSDGLPVLFRQQRVGRDERPFTLWKFRSMRQGTADLPTHLASAASVTAIGRFLRRSKLDELPQLWNVLKGEMSFVGPRPCLPSQTDIIEARRRRGALSLPVGITGLAQLRGFDFSTPEQVASSDAEYGRRASLAFDLWLIMQTAVGRAKDDADARMSS
jgi:O-antigen biosynthesis protein WbqP